VTEKHKAACDLVEEPLQDAHEIYKDAVIDWLSDAKSLTKLYKENLTLWREEHEDRNEFFAL
jgi:hypothetical protein